MTQPGAVDRDVLARLIADTGDDTEFVAELIEAFALAAPQLAADVRASHTGGDLEALRRAAHTLKSNGATLGAHRLAEAAADVERTADAGQALPGDACDRLDGLVSEAIDALRGVSLEELTA